MFEFAIYSYKLKFTIILFNGILLHKININTFIRLYTCFIDKLLTRDFESIAALQN